MTFQFRPAKRENTPLVIGIAGPTKSGKTYSAHRLAVGLAGGRPIVKINAEGANGHQYDDLFPHVCADITAPFRPERYTEALRQAYALEPKPAVIIIDSGSHMHDGPGGILQYHEDELDRMVGQDYKARERATFAAWVKPKAAENEFIYAMLESACHIVLCLRAKEKIKIVRGKAPIDLGWQPIVGERVAFETIFTLLLPPRSKGVPDLSGSDMREPFDSMIPVGKALSEETGVRLAEWAAGGTQPLSSLDATVANLQSNGGLAEPGVSTVDGGHPPSVASPDVGGAAPGSASSLDDLIGTYGIAECIKAARDVFPGRPVRELSPDEVRVLADRLTGATVEA